MTSVAPIWLACLLAAADSAAGSAPPPGGIRFRDVTAQAGITFRHTDGSSGRRYIVEYVSAGLATFDYDGDGLTDIYFVNGAPLPGTVSQTIPRNALYRNLGEFRFADVTDAAGVGDTGFGLGATVADYDNDGFPDLYVSNFGPNVLYRNNGDGTFSDVTKQAGVGRGDKVGAGVAFLDADSDGCLDLFVSNYVVFSFDSAVTRRLKGVPSYASPLDYTPDRNDFFRNQGDGTFRDAGRESGIAAHAGTGMGMVCADVNGDGHTDIVIANDVMPNFFFKNDGRGNFQEAGLLAGLAFDVAGSPHGSMGVDAGDFDNDGLLDFVVTAYQREFTTLYRNLGGDLFADVTRPTGAGEGSFSNVKWGCGLVDFDNDGHRDLFVACGHIDDNVELRDDTTSYLGRCVVLRNTGNRKFVHVTDQAGDGLSQRRSHRGAAFDDLDNDGRIDVVLLNSRSPPAILRNESGNGNHWLQLQVRARQSNRDSVGARVKLVAGNLVLVDEIHSGRGYQSHYGSRLHFGLGPQQRVDRLEIGWVGGGTGALRDLPVDQCLTVFDGTGATPVPNPVEQGPRD